MLRKPTKYTVEALFENVDTTMNLFNAQFKDSEPLEDLVMDVFRITLSVYERELELTDLQVNTFKYHPKALSKAIYGTTDLFFILMTLNNCTHYSDFLGNGNTLIVYSQEGIKELAKFYDTYHNQY